MKKLGFIGLGLIGGSLARVFKKNMPDCHILVYSRTKENIKPALDDKIADFFTSKIDDSFKDRDIIFCCAPVDGIADSFELLAKHTSSDCIITDVGSTKQYIMKCAKKYGLENCFIGGHPMSGSEKTGYINSSAELFYGNPYILTPFDNTPYQKLETLKELLEYTKSHILICDPKSHDKAAAAISHLPHIAAASLSETVCKQDSDGFCSSIAGTGFKDTTRIAASSPEIWEQIIMSNKESVINILDDYINRLQNISTQLKSGKSEALSEAFKNGGEYINEINKK